MKLVIGLTGHPLAGKETVAERIAALLERDGYTVSRHRFSDILRETLTLWGMPHGRDNEQKLAQAMDQMSAGTLSRAMENRLAKDVADVGILDGVRWFTDEEMIRGFSAKGMKSFIVYILADADIRYARLVKRARSGEHTTTREEFDLQNKQKNEIFISEIGSRADAVIENNFESVDELIAAVDAAYERNIKPLL